MSDFDQEALAEVYNRGLAEEKAGNRNAAAEAYRQALRLDPDDHGGVSIRLAAMGLAAPPEKMPDAYVATLFDQHADDFDDILVERLRYDVPLQLRQLLRDQGITHLDRGLDLGCGTGLVGMALRDCFNHLTGVDLSERIVELAFDRQVYDDLYVGEVVSFLEEFEAEDGDGFARWDMIVAADVFPYLGRIEPMIAATAARLPPGGYFGFSTETFPDGVACDDPYAVGSGRRFAHSGSYIRNELEKAEFEIRVMDAITVRLEEGEPVPGHLVLARLRG